MANNSISICVLFYEKTNQTIDCVNSFLSSGCPIYLLNNGSSIEARVKFSSWAEQFPQVKIFNSPENLGVSGGRNFLINQTNSEWLFFVDNDITVTTPYWHQAFSTHAASMPDVEVFIPRLYNHHESSYARYRVISVENDRAVLSEASGTRINSFPGGAAIVRRSLFDRLGLYDERIFVGIEDVELALRGVLTGTPISSQLVSDIELRHSHGSNYTEMSDIKAVLLRYNKKMIQQSYKTVTEKHGVSIDDGWEIWVDHQLRGIPREDSEIINDNSSKMPSIALVVDSDGWAFSNIANNIEKQLSHKYLIKIYYVGTYDQCYDKLINDLYNSDNDIIHYFWRADIFKIYLHMLQSKVNANRILKESFVRIKHTFSIYDHCYLEEAELNDFRLLFNYLSDAYVVSSYRLYHIYSRFPDLSKPYGVIEDGVDFTKFYPANTDRLSEQDRPIIIGWAGNSSWGKDFSCYDYKGLKTIIQPAIEELRNEGFKVEGRFADRNMIHIPYDAMVNYYNSIDVYVCASSVEGTPNPVLEAMACGLPIVTTDVGVVPQVFGCEQKKYILIIRSVENLKEKLKELILNPTQRMKLSQENLVSIRDWTRECESTKWDAFFSHVLNSNDDKKQLCKRACLEIPYYYQFESVVDKFLKDSISWKITRPLRSINWHAIYYKNKITSIMKSIRNRK